MRIGPYPIEAPVLLAPMAGTTDLPFRRLCRRLGAGLAVSEMTTADPRLWHTRKSRQRLDFTAEPGPVSVQLAGTDPGQLAEAARVLAGRGAHIIDLNMGCPAKKVCSVAAGSALLRDEPLVGRILAAVVGAAGVPVTLKMRTGYARGERNAVRIARIAEEAGIAALAVHGRTREDHFRGEAEYATIAAVKAAVGIPVVANGDITAPAKARAVLAATGCDAVMIGRGALGRPWIFREIAHELRTGTALPPPGADEVRAIVLGHLDALHDFHGEWMGLRIARRHLAWYARDRAGAAAFRAAVNGIEQASEQRRLAADYFAGIGATPGAPATAADPLAA